jgi:hypothetical protein
MDEAGHLSVRAHAMRLAWATRVTRRAWHVGNQGSEARVSGKGLAPWSTRPSGSRRLGRSRARAVGLHRLRPAGTPRASGLGMT